MRSTFKARIAPGGNGERGQALVEFALASTVALTLIFGTIEFGQAVFTYGLVADAARFGTRYAIVHGSGCTGPACPASATAVQTYTRSQVSAGIAVSQLGVTTTWSPHGACTASPYQGPGCLVTVQASYPLHILMYGWSTMTISSSSQMTISQ